jgi:hypothetical protein
MHSQQVTCPSPPEKKFVGSSRERRLACGKSYATLQRLNNGSVGVAAGHSEKVKQCTFNSSAQG